MAEANIYLARCYAQTGQMKLAWKNEDLACDHLKKDLANYAKVREALMDAELYCLEGKTTEAQDTLRNAAQILNRQTDHLLFEQLRNKWKELKLCDTELTLIENTIKFTAIPTSKINIAHHSGIKGHNGTVAMAIQYILGAIITTNIVFAETPNWQITIPCIILCIATQLFFNQCRYKKIKIARKLLQTSREQEVNFTIEQQGGLEFHTQENRIAGTYFANEELSCRLQKLAPKGTFKGTVYSDEAGNLRALETYGYFSVLSRSFYLP
jgi:hypothetical protein